MKTSRIFVLEEGIVSANEPNFCAFCNPIISRQTK